METVGVRELKDRLAHYLHIVQQGRTIVVTARGKPVARLVPLSAPGKKTLPQDLEDRMWQLAAQGFLTWSGRRFQIPDPVAINQGPEQFSDLVVEDRE